MFQAVKFIEPQLRLAAKAGKQKKEYKLSLVSERTMEKIRSLSEAPIEAIFTDPSYGKVALLNTFLCFFIKCIEGLEL